MARRANNLKNIDVDIPLRRFTAVTGVSGSGKSAWYTTCFIKIWPINFITRNYKAGGIKAISGVEYVNRVINIDQSPIGRTPRSNPATYVGAWTYIRDLLRPRRMLESADINRAGSVSTCRAGGVKIAKGTARLRLKCISCRRSIVTCDVCKGKRLTAKRWKCEYKGKNIYDILKMTIEEAVDFFNDIPWLHDKLLILEEVGLGLS